MPGAQLQAVDGDEYHGVVKVKVGPITTQYKGVAHFSEKDAVAHRAVLRAEGRETRGQGNAAATVSATLEPDGDGTSVSIVTDLQITGRVAQFGRGVLADVSTKLLGQFVQRLEADLLLGEGSASSALGEPADRGERSASVAPAAPMAPAVDGSAPRGRIIDSAEAEPADLFDIAGGAVVKRLAPIGIGALFVLVVWWLRRRRQ
jgi:carbon monoxide dehydrogenase subunit G